jgi:hypothetical protein
MGLRRRIISFGKLVAIVALAVAGPYAARDNRQKVRLSAGR